MEQTFQRHYALLTGDLGRDLSEGQRQLVRRVTTISITCERMDSAAAAGRDFDHALYSSIPNSSAAHCSARSEATATERGIVMGGQVYIPQ